MIWHEKSDADWTVLCSQAPLRDMQVGWRYLISRCWKTQDNSDIESHMYSVCYAMTNGRVFRQSYQHTVKAFDVNISSFRRVKPVDTGYNDLNMIVENWRQLWRLYWSMQENNLGKLMMITYLDEGKQQWEHWQWSTKQQQSGILFHCQVMVFTHRFGRDPSPFQPIIQLIHHAHHIVS